MAGVRRIADDNEDVLVGLDLGSGVVVLRNVLGEGKLGMGLGWL